MSQRLPPPRYLVLGQILRPHGVRGELRMRLHTDYPERITKLKTVYLSPRENDANPKPYSIAGMRMNKAYGLLRLKEIPDRNAAERFRGLYVLVSYDEAVPLADDEFYLYQLIGLRVETEDGFVLGTIKDYLETGANDVYVVDSPEYGEVLFPATHETIINHDIENGVVRVHILDGLLPDRKTPPSTD